MGQNEERLQDLGFYRTRLWTYLAVNVRCSSRKWKTEVVSLETMRTPVPAQAQQTRLFSPFQRVGLPLWFLWARRSPPVPQEQGCPVDPLEPPTPQSLGVHTSVEQHLRGETNALVCPKGRVSNQKGFFSSLKSDGIFLARLWTCLGPATSSFFLISASQNGNVYHVPVPRLYCRST